MLFQAVEASMQPSFRHEREHLHLNAGSAHLNMSFILLYLLGSCHIHAMFKMKALLVLVSGTTACMAGACGVRCCFLNLTEDVGKVGCRNPETGKPPKIPPAQQCCGILGAQVFMKLRGCLETNAS